MRISFTKYFFLRVPKISYVDKFGAKLFNWIIKFSLWNWRIYLVSSLTKIINKCIVRHSNCGCMHHKNVSNIHQKRWYFRPISRVEHVFPFKFFKYFYFYLMSYAQRVCLYYSLSLSLCLSCGLIIFNAMALSWCVHTFRSAWQTHEKFNEIQKRRHETALRLLLLLLLIVNNIMEKNVFQTSRLIVEKSCVMKRVVFGSSNKFKLKTSEQLSVHINIILSGSCCACLCVCELVVPCSQQLVLLLFSSLFRIRLIFFTLFASERIPDG